MQKVIIQACPSFTSVDIFHLLLLRYYITPVRLSFTKIAYKPQEPSPWFIRCRPYNPRAKGKVENGVKYLKGNFWPRLKVIHSISDLNAQVRLWLDTKCNVRLHNTTHKRPIDELRRERLKPVNNDFLLHDLHSRKVMNDCRISYLTNLYSVPYQYVGLRVGVKDLRNGDIEIYNEQGALIAIHEKAIGKHKIKDNKKHFEGIKTWSQKKVATTAPKLIPDTPPKVHQRSLKIYDSLVNEVIL